MTAVDENAITCEVAMVGQSRRAGAYSGRTAWARNLQSPLRIDTLSAAVRAAGARATFTML